MIKATKEPIVYSDVRFVEINYQRYENVSVNCIFLSYLKFANFVDLNSEIDLR